MSDRRFIIIYDTYCGWCYGASPVFDALVDTGAEVEVLHRHLFQGDMAQRLADGKGAMIMQADAQIAALTGQTFSQAYKDNLLGSDTEVLDSGYTAEAAALVHEQGAVREFAVRARLEHARYVDGISASDRDAVVAALIDEGLPADQAQLIGTPELAARARITAERAASLMERVGAHGVPTVLAVTDGVLEPVDHARFFGRPEAIARLAGLPVERSA